ISLSRTGSCSEPNTFLIAGRRRAPPPTPPQEWGEKICDRRSYLLPPSPEGGLRGVCATNRSGRPLWVGRYHASERVTSFPLVVLNARQMGRLIESLMKWTLPSQNTAFTPPGWRLREA